MPHRCSCAAADVVTSTATTLVFRTPARVAGAYDVHVFARDGRTSVLEGALTQTDDPLEPAPGEDSDGTDGFDGPDGSGGDPGPEDGSDGSDGEDSNESTTVVRTGSNGERLARTTRFSGLGSSF